MVPRQKTLQTHVEYSPDWSIQRILVPVDFSEHSERALLYAAAFARHFNARLLLLHVIQSVAAVYDIGPNFDVSEKLDHELRTHSQKKLTELAARLLSSKVEVDYEIRSGNVVEEAIECAKNQAVDLIVTATHGRTGLKHVFLGSVAEGLVRYANCPVLVVRTTEAGFAGKGLKDESGLDFKTILVAVDFSESSDFVLNYAESVAKATGAALIISHVVPIHYPISEYGVLECPQLDAELLEAGRRHVRELVEAEKKNRIFASHEVRQGKAGVEILDIAHASKVDLIVMGTRGLTGLKHVLLGSTAAYVVRHARCPVITVRCPSDEGDATNPPLSTARANVRRGNMESLQSIVRSHPFLQNMSPNDLEVILKDAVVAEFERGEIIFREGEYADKFYLIHEGKVALECHTPERNVPVQTLNAGEVLGWSWLFPPFSWHLQARAVAATTALQLNGAHILIASENDEKFGHQLMKRFAQILVQRLQETRKRLVEKCEETKTELGEIL